jgi:hypothetical protein
MFVGAFFRRTNLGKLDPIHLQRALFLPYVEWFYGDESLPIFIAARDNDKGVG